MKCLLITCGAAFVALATFCSGSGIFPASANAIEKCAGGDRPRAVYTMSNAANANSVLVYRRACNGSLTLKGTFPTGGRGTALALAIKAASF